MTGRVPVTLRNDRPWELKKTFRRLCILLESASQRDPAEVKAAAIGRIGLDEKSRRREGNEMELKTDRRMHQAYKISKGLTFELLSAAALTHLDNPREVRCNCVLNKNEYPNKFASGGKADIVFEPLAAKPPFRIVCEVSANRDFGDCTLEEQLGSALAHARKLNIDGPRRLTYGLLINPGDIGTDIALQQKYRAFVADKERGLKMRGLIRLVSISTGDFVTILYRLHAAGHLALDSRLFAHALNVLHKHLREDIPDKQDWMATTFLETIARGMGLQADAFAYKMS